MTRAPYEPVQITEPLRPQAAPVDTFVRAAAPAEDSSLMDLARGLSKLDAGLATFVESRKAERDKEDALRGEAEFHKNNRLGYAEAVSQGLIPAYASKSFVSAYKAAQGSVYGYDLERKFNAAYDAWGGKNSDDPAAYESFVGSFLKENIQTDDPDILRGLLPRVRGITEQGANRYQQDRHEATLNGSIKAHAAEVDNAIDEENRVGLGAEKGPDYPKLFGSIQGIRQKAIESGISPDRIDPQIVDAVTAKAIELRDPKVLEFLDQNVPGTNYSYKDTPYGRKAKAETMNTLEVMGRQAIEREHKEQQERDRKAKDDVTRRTVEAIIDNPNGPLPDELLKEGTRYDPDFKINAMKWKAEVYQDRGSSDPEALTDLNWRIINGGGMAVVREGMEKGLFGTREDLVAAYNLAQEMEKNGKSMDQMLRSGSAQTILGTINKRTQDEYSVEQIFSPEGITDKGLAAQYDFKRAILEWAAQHPNASIREQEIAINAIGSEILGRITQEEGGLEGSRYNREGFTEPNPYQLQDSQPQQSSSQRQSQAQGQPQAATSPTPQQRTQAPAPVQQAAPQAPAPQAPAAVQPPKPEEVQTWFRSLPPEMQAKAEARAKELGTSVDAVAAFIYQQQVLKGLIKPNPPQPAPSSAPQKTGSIEPTVQLASAGGDIVNQVSEAIRQWSEEDPVAQDVVNQVGSLIEQAINGTGDFSKDHTLATLNEDPKAARILDFVAGPESRGNYNAYYANGNSTNDISKFTLDEVIRWQKRRTDNGSPSSATGRYQFMRNTLASLKTEMGLTGTEKFTPELQDRLAFQLLRRRGYDRWKAGKMSTTTFANELAKEWASLPNLHTGRSHYAGDGLNKSLVSPRDVLKALGPRRI